MSFVSTTYTLWLREIIRFQRNRSRLIGSMALPLIFFVILGSGFSGFFSYRGGISYIEFIGPGIIGMQLLFASIFGGMSVLWDRQFGFLKEILVAPVSRIGIMTGKTVGTVTTSMLKGLVFLAAIVATGYVKTDVNGILLVLLMMFLISTAFVAVGIAFAAKMSDPHGFQLIMNFLIMPVFFLSGALFPLENLPPWLTILTHLNPLTYGVDGMRFGLGGPYRFSPMLNISVLTLFSIGTIIVGAILFRRMPA